MITATCHRCRRVLPASHPWLRIERGAGPPAIAATDADRNYCSPACWAADLTDPTPQENPA